MKDDGFEGIGFGVISKFALWLSEMEPSGMLFRGHSDERFELIPRAYRPGQHGITDDKSLSKWKEAAARFANPKPTSDIGWLVLAQHYGIPTNLLDWTSNPLIALHFACAGQSADQGRGCVIAIDREAFEDGADAERHAPFMRQRSVPGLIDASAMNVRSIAQDSYMSIHPKGWTAMTQSQTNHKVFSVTDQAKALLIQPLRVLGISEERLYSDLATVVTVFQRKLDFNGEFGISW